jgi:hypothetical protein
MLIAVLFSTIALSEALSIRLYRAAIDLEREGRGVEKLVGELAMGEVRRLGKVEALGSLVGPTFEAELDTTAGSGRVRFIVTEQALRHEGVGEAPPAHALN